MVDRGVMYLSAASPSPVHSATSSRVTASHPNSEVKLLRVWVVLPSGRGREGQMLNVLSFEFLIFIRVFEVFDMS